MPLKRGLWLTLIDDADEAYPVACDITDQQQDLWRLEAMVPPQVYPVRFVSARLRLDGNHLGMLRLPEPVVTVTHQPMDLSLDFPIDQRRLNGTALSNA
ncbi:MAG: hypothetical protein K0Q72_3171 [Armatimonadetes bacterium]|jgi:hypothetical protein|nr:hypothetical protein [Armatimonadota bacterium]